MTNLVRDPSFCVVKRTWTLKASAPKRIKRLYVPLKNFTSEDLPALVADFEHYNIRGPPQSPDSRTPLCSSHASFSDFLDGRIPLLPPSQRVQQPPRQGQYIDDGHWIFQYLHANQDEEDEFDWNYVSERRTSSVFSREDTPTQMYPYNPMMNTIHEVDGTSLSREGSLAPHNAQTHAASRAPTPLRHATPTGTQVLAHTASMDGTHWQTATTPTYDRATTAPPTAEPSSGRRYPSRCHHPPRPRYDPIIHSSARPSSKPKSICSSPVKASVVKTKEADLACPRCSKDSKLQDGINFS